MSTRYRLEIKYINGMAERYYFHTLKELEKAYVDITNGSDYFHDILSVDKKVLE